MEPDTHFYRVQPLREIERRLMRDTANSSSAVSPADHVVLRYAFALAQLGWIRTEHGDVDVFESVAPFRHWLVEQLEFFVDIEKSHATDFRGINGLLPTIRSRVTDVRRHLLARHVNELSESRLEAELTERALVMILGGGGGSGYTHLGAFATVAELGLEPRMIVGSSMGALMGLYRSIKADYDPMAVALTLPRPSEFGRVFSPYRGFSRFGFPGALELKIRQIGGEVFNKLLGVGIPRFNELPIELRVVVTGLRTGIGLAISEVEGQISRSFVRFSPLRIRRQFQLFFGVLRHMLDKPRFLQEIVFGSDEGTREFDTLDAVGFSCAVPAFLHYDLFDSSDDSVNFVNRLFAERQLFRLTDGGVVSNVASRAGWRCVQRGEIHTRNAFILAFDAFGPVATTNTLYYPIQRLVNRGVRAQRKYSDFHVTYRQPPSPVELLKSFDSLQDAIARVRKQLKPEREYLRMMTSRVPEWPVFLEQASHSATP